MVPATLSGISEITSGNAEGSSEVGSCIRHYIQSLPPTIEKLTLYSGTCGGQNRNKNIVAFFLYIVNTSQNLKVIDLKFFKSGHSMMEADSIHATIERARKDKQLYIPREYRLLMEMARKDPGPYEVHELRYSDILDLEKLATDVIQNRNKCTDNTTLSWLRCKWFRFTKGNCRIEFKYDVTAPFESIDVGSDFYRLEQHRH